MNTGKKALATIALGVDSKGLPRPLEDAKKKLRSFGADAKKILGKGMGVGKGMLGGAAGLMGAGFGIQAASGLTDMFGDMLAFEKNLTRFQITSGKTGAEMATLRSSILAVSKATGVAQGEVLAGASTYVDLTGDVKGAEAAMNSFARIAQASGASVADVSTATAALQQSMKLDPKDIEAVFSGLISQGKMGAVSLKDFAGELSALAPKFAKFGGGTGNAAILNLGAALQAARQGFGSASEAATGLEALMGALATNGKKFAAAGVKIFNVDKKGVKTFKSFDQIINAIGKSKLAKDPTLLAKAFGSKEALQAYDMLVRNKGMLAELAVAGRDAGAVQRDLATYQESSAGKMEAAWNRIKVALAEAMTPDRIEKFATAITKLSDLLIGVIGLVEKLGKSTYDIGEDLVVEKLKGETGTRAEKMKRAGELSREQMPNADMAHARDRAVKELMAESTMQSSQQRAMVGFDQGISKQRTEAATNPLAATERIARSITEGFAKAKITVQTDANGLQKVAANAKNHRKR